MTSETMYGSWSLRVDNSKPTLKALVDTPLDDAKDNLTTPAVINEGDHNTLVNLQVQFKDREKGASHWSKATGLLIRPDLVVTTGHATYDHDNGRGKAVEVLAYVGYNSKKPIDDPSVHVRKGLKVAVPKAWIDGDRYRTQDIAFIQLDRPFKDIMPFQYGAKPGGGDHPSLGVIGYPGDSDSDGAAVQMYGSWNGETYGLAKEPGGQHFTRSASRIPLEGVMKAMDGSGTAVKTVGGIDYIHVRGPNNA
ncbi:uncharacterized protein FIESC28_08711 [Fusarium coffeatum]|uniref:Peptidase S1 domain-containing protein n=1 Tax=Fusarium coffeatum TaxID=231269 RepID=A0A366R7T4_9HYPO|nr:uncharacterized protein FIESC28_08711 [Fusarium coffeatum]RBR12225.1 hypothetical protein FIESC28_08711 [Fusarium coffeatum]